MSTKRSYRTKPSTFFMLLSAIAGCIHLINGTLARILTIGFNIDLTRTSIGLCKLRQFIYIIVPGFGITCYWLSTINQFLVTSRSARLRQLSNMKLVYRTIIIIIIFWIVHGTPTLIFANIESGTCIIDNSILSMYYVYVHFWSFCTIIPIGILIIFGILAYRNMRLLTNVRQLHGIDRQLTLMVCGQVLLILIGVAPYALFNIYSTSTAQWNKDIEQKNKETFILNVVSLNSTIEFGASFYLFIIISSSFRQQVKQYLYSCWIKPNIVQPTDMNIRTLD
ncbi:unnamed protein product [Adineta steineri]|uniref:G-protein coupled receptors family 1 profile domain-containing protein n=1 Tax=Adineta steineri TaxID=433720 RepID=A0A815AWK7_9BILA|nr:unnamed protein product [Adineta steineri]CAF1551530.1 unnamed protein product [Adineta steineri]